MRKFLLTLTALSAAPVPALAEAPGDDTIVVYGTRLGQSLNRAGLPVTILTGDDLREKGFAFALDAIASAPGVTINQNAPFGGAASVRIRGAASDQTLVLIDGIPAGDPSAPGGGFDFARLDTDQIERIEILRGPQSTLWGSEAIGGVVSITTKKKSENLLSAFAEAGSFGTSRGGAALTLDNDDGFLRLGIAGTDTDGVSKADEAEGNTEEDGFTARTTSLSGAYRLSGQAGLRVSLLHTDAETAFDGFDFTAPGFVADADETSETEELYAHAALDLKTGALAHTLLVGRATIDRQNLSAGSPGFSAEGERTTYRYQGTLSPDESSALAFGAEHDVREADGEETSITSLFALGEKTLSTLTVSAGLRLDDHETFGSETTARLALAYAARPGVTFRASWGEGFKAPSLFQQTYVCCGAAAPDPDLAPERSEGFDLGLVLTAPRASFEAGYFLLETDDLLTFSFTDGGYANIEEARSEGIELSGRIDLLPWLGIEAAYAFIEAEDGDGRPLPRVPEHSGDLSFVLDPRGPLSGSLLVRHNGEEEDGAATLDAWTRLDLNARYALTDTLELYGRAENLTDEDYQQVLGYGTPGRSGHAGVRVRF